MKVVYVSNIFSRHQIALSDALYRLTDGNYRFVATIPIRENIQAYYSVDEAREYVLPVYADDSAAAEALKWIRDADAAVFAGAPERFVRERLKSGKLMFRCTERPLKNGPEPLKYLPRLLRWHWQNPPGAPIYLLCSSAYTAADYAKFGLFRGRAFRWGYFPETIRYPDLNEVMAGKDPKKIVWVGRMLPWKHPDDAIRAAARLKQAGSAFSLDLIGGGEMEPILRELIRENDLSDCVRLLGVLSSEDVRWHMREAGIFLMTSDRREGWGSVLNEAMNAGCAVVASSAAGAVPYLIAHEQNGLRYDAGDVGALTGHVAGLLDAPQRQRALGEAAYETITTLWNAETAAERLLALTEALLTGRRSVELFETGPCSQESGREH